MRELSLEGELAMPKGRRLGAEQIVTKLRQIEVLQGQGKNIAAACKEIGTMEETQGRVPSVIGAWASSTKPFRYRLGSQSAAWRRWR